MMFFILFAPAFLLKPAGAQQPAPPAISTSAALPAYISLSPSINEFGRFADGGSDANWYVGFNNAWIVKLSPAPLGEFSRAFIGAKIGRAKTRPNPNKPWLRELIDGKIYMALSQTPSFGAEQSFFLAETSDIPLDPDPQAYVEGVGSAEWFWAEVPLSLLSFTRPNYLIIWSPTKYFLRASSSPILAAASLEDGEAPREPRAWNNHSISGVPPRNASGSLETPLNFNPALAIKLVPPSQTEVNVSEFSLWKSGRKAVIQFSVWGENIVESWVESSRDQLDWQRVSRLVRRQPLVFSLAQDKIPAPGWFLRGAARDVYGNTGFSEPYPIPYASP